MQPPTLCLGAAVACVMLGACGEVYCQSGSKYGTQCYTMEQVEWQETQQRPDPPPERATEPSPGCVLMTPKGPHVVPPPAPSWVAQPARPPFYVMSGACVTSRQTAYGAK